MPTNLFDNPTSPPDDSPGAVFSGGLLTEDTSTGSHYLLVYGSAVTSGNTYTFSVEAKANGRTWLAIQPQPTGFPAREAYFDLSGGAVGTVDSELVAARIEDLGSGWYRCSATIIATGSPSSLSCAFVLCEADNDFIYTGDGASGVYLQNFVAISPFLSVSSTNIDGAVNGFSRIAEARAPEIVLGADGGILSGVVSSRTHRNVYEVTTAPMLSTAAGDLVGVLTSGMEVSVAGNLFATSFTAYAGDLEVDFTEGGLYRVLSFSLYESAT